MLNQIAVNLLFRHVFYKLTKLSIFIFCGFAKSEKIYSRGEGFPPPKRLNKMNQAFNNRGNCMPTKSARFQHIHYPPEVGIQEHAKFPNTRYFQIHFEYLESQLAETRHSLEALQAQMAKLMSTISLMAAELTENKGPQ